MTEDEREDGSEDGREDGRDGGLHSFAEEKEEKVERCFDWFVDFCAKYFILADVGLISGSCRARRWD